MIQKTLYIKQRKLYSIKQCFSLLILLSLPCIKTFAYKKDNTEVLFYYNKGNELLELKNYQEAAASYDLALKYSMYSDISYLNKGDVEKLKKYKDRLAEYIPGKKYKINYTDAYVLKGMVLDILEKHKEAIIVYDLVIKHRPDFALAYYAKGFSLHNLERYKEAIHTI